jgi:hypothetical protein
MERWDRTNSGLTRSGEHLTYYLIIVLIEQGPFVGAGEIELPVSPQHRGDS